MALKDHSLDDKIIKAAFDEFPGRHRFPAVVIGVADDKAGKHEEKIDGQVAVVDDLVHMAGGVGFKDVEPYDDNGGYAAQTGKYVVVVFFTAWGNGRMLRFQHERSCCPMLFLF